MPDDPQEGEPFVLVDGERLPLDQPIAAVTPPRVVSSRTFLGLFTPAEIHALWNADPALMAGALEVISDSSVNLGHPRLAALLDIAVARGVLSSDRKAAIIAGEAPT